jgi:alpha-tubulin suppressor-like RCC1 family protein
VRGPQVIAGVAGVNAMALGLTFTCALTASGIACWGSGALGDGMSSTNVTTPVPIGGVTNPRSIAAGYYHVCAVGTAGVSCWGSNFAGQLGDGTTTDKLVPTVIAGTTTDTSVWAGGSTTCAIDSAGALTCWGVNGSGQLGVGDLVDRHAPTAVVGLPSADPAVQMALSYDRTCVRLSSGRVFCTGANGMGDMGSSFIELPAFAGASDLGAGPNATCAIIGGQLECAGDQTLSTDQAGLTASMTPTPVRLPACN